MAEKLYFGRNNEMGRKFYEEVDGVKTVKNLTTATKIELQFFKDPGTPVASFNTTDNATLFDLSQVASGIVVFKPLDDTFTTTQQSLILDDEDHGTCFGQYIVYTTLQPDGVVFPEFEVDFEKI